MIETIIDGPLWYFSLAVFGIGVTWQLIRIGFASRGADLSVARASASSGAIKTLFSRFLPHKEMASKTSIQFIAGYLFHLGLFALMFFAAPHVVFLEENLLGFGWTAMPHWAFIVSAQVAFLGLLILWLRRMVNPVSRLISTRDDHIVAILTFVVMLTGCFALLEGSTALRLLHRFTVELWLIYFPFSALMHTFTFVPSRMFTGAWFGRRGIDA
jgi:nitrate reductase gamma subunit